MTDFEWYGLVLGLVGFFVIVLVLRVLLYLGSYLDAKSRLVNAQHLNEIHRGGR